jgi:hypothetical protein
VIDVSQLGKWGYKKKEKEAEEGGGNQNHFEKILARCNHSNLQRKMTIED